MRSWVTKTLVRNAAGTRGFREWGRRAISLVLIGLLVATILAPVPLPRLLVNGPAPADASDLGESPAEEAETTPEMAATLRRTLRQSAGGPCWTRRDWMPVLPPHAGRDAAGAWEIAGTSPSLFELGARLRC